MMNKNDIAIENMPAISGLNFRKFLGKNDFPKMVVIIDAASRIDHTEQAIAVNDIEHDYAHLTNSDPKQDMIFAEVNGEAVAYSRVDWYQEEDPNDRIYGHFVYIKPEYRGLGIEIPMIQWCENRLRKISADHPNDSHRFFQTYSHGNKEAFNKILEEQGYFAARYFIEMSRDLDIIPTANLPEGIEVHPVDKKDERKIWDASIEAFRDHWGFAEPKEEDYIAFEGSKYFQPELWQVAWDGDEVVASVMNYIDHAQNKKFDRKRGWTENISTRREWRRRGIAKALIVRSMQMHKDQGMTEVALGVDTNNPNHALALYQSLGYQKTKTMITYRKTMQ